MNETQEDSRRLPVVVGVLALVLVVAGAAWWTYQSPERVVPYSGPPRFAVSPELDHPSLRETMPPWPALAPGLRERLEGSAVAYGEDEMTAFHTHQHLSVYVEGRAVKLPANIGIDSQAGIIAALHTHDESGVIHVEASAARRYTLGQFFDVWGVRLGGGCLGSRCGGLRLFANGQEVAGDPRALVLEQHQQIVVAVAKVGEVTLPPPYDFSGYR